MEKWDAYDINCNIVKEKELIRGEEIPEGLFHAVTDIIVKHIDGTYLITQRYEHKKNGLMWEASAGGSVLQGETPLESAIRELKEETGIEAKDITELGRVVHYRHKSIYFEYICETDIDKDSIVLQEGETQDYKWITREELVNFPKQELLTDRIQIFIRELQR